MVHRSGARPFLVDAVRVGRGSWYILRPPVPQRDRYHDAVRRALVKDGWTITHDPLTVPAGQHNVYVDLGAERMLAAERRTGQAAGACGA